MTDDLEIPIFLRRDEVPRHVCAQCGASDGKEEPVRHGDALVWLHPECRRFWLREPGNYADARVAKPEQTKQIARPLHVLAPLIKKELEQGRLAAHRAAMPYYLAAGKLLHEAKAQLPHGRFMPWVKETLSVTHRQATDYMALAEHEAAETGSTLPFSTITQFIRETRNPNYNKPQSPPPDRAAYISNLHAENNKRIEEQKVLNRVCVEIINLGYKALAAKVHPDRGGPPEAMTRLNQARDKLNERFSRELAKTPMPF